MTLGTNTEEETRHLLLETMARQQEEPRTQHAFAVIQTAEDALIGNCLVRISSVRNREGEIGFCFARSHWGRGYATETARRLIGFGFTELSLHRIWATCDPENVASGRVLEKSGMTREGRLREHVCIQGSWRDSYLYAILDQEWKQATTET